MFHKVQTKILLLISAITIIVVGSLAVFRANEFTNASMLLEDRKNEKLSILANSIKNLESGIANIVFENSYWDEMVEFTKTPDLNWAKENIDAALVSHRAQMTWVTNTELKAIYAHAAYDSLLIGSIPIPLKQFNVIKDSLGFTHFYFALNGNVFSVYGAPIQPTADINRVSQPSGYYFIARTLDRSYADELEGFVPDSIEIIMGKHLPAIQSGGSVIVVKHAIKDAYGEVIAYVILKSNQPFFDLFLQTKQREFYFVLVISLGIVLLIALFLFFTVRRPLHNIEKALIENDEKYIATMLEGHSEFSTISRLIAGHFKQSEELKRTMLLAEQSNKLKSSLLSNMSHELRTPMNGIIGFSQLIESAATDTNIIDMAKGIGSSALRLTETFDAIVRLADLESDFAKEFILEDYSLHHLIPTVAKRFEQMARDKALLFDIKIEKHVHGRIEKSFFRQSLSYLIDNALKFTHRGGIVIVLTQNEQKEIEIQVIDSGIGIAKENLDMIFEEFRQISEGYSRSFEGSGLGLTLAKKMVSLMSGRIEVESELGKGSKFSLVLPYYPDINEISEETLRFIEEMHASNNSEDSNNKD